MHALIPMNTRTQTLPLGAFSKTGLANPQDWQIRQRRLAVDRNLFFFELQNISEETHLSLRIHVRKPYY
jgi:hypothetical protein